MWTWMYQRAWICWNMVWISLSLSPLLIPYGYPRDPCPSSWIVLLPVCLCASILDQPPICFLNSFSLRFLWINLWLLWINFAPVCLTCCCCLLELKKRRGRNLPYLSFGLWEYYGCISPPPYLLAYFSHFGGRGPWYLISLCFGKWVPNFLVWFLIIIYLVYL